MDVRICEARNGSEDGLFIVLQTGATDFTGVAAARGHGMSDALWVLDLQAGAGIRLNADGTTEEAGMIAVRPLLRAFAAWLRDRAPTEIDDLPARVDLSRRVVTVEVEGLRVRAAVTGGPHYEILSVIDSAGKPARGPADLLDLFEAAVAAKRRRKKPMARAGVQGEPARRRDVG